MIVVGRTTTQVQEEIWDKKIKPFLDTNEYTETRVANKLIKVTHRNGNKILFFSHHSPQEAREKIQAFTAEWLWLDEMPNSFGLLEELHARVQGSGCRFLATFTPKVVNGDIRKLVDTKSNIHKKYKLFMLSNPINQTKEQMEKIAARTATMNDAYRKTILEGDWYLGEEAVYQFNSQVHAVKDIPHSPEHRHIIAVDPAASGKAGYILLWENPTNGKWTVIKAAYVKGNAARPLLAEFNRLTGNRNVVRRICDPHEAWFIKDAALEGVTFDGVHKKNERKKELLKNVQNMLDDSTLTIAEWCTDLIDEFTTCQWSERVKDKIIGASRFHLLDSLQYGIDDLPIHVPFVTPETWEGMLRRKNKERQVLEQKRRAKSHRRRKWYH